MSLENGFLPVTMEEVLELGITQLDFIYVTGDAYVDHPSFGHAIITRLLSSHGYHVGIISQPDWKNDESITVLGTPRLGFLVSSGNMDSMVNHYYVSKKHREMDAYTPGGAAYKRPDHATVVYSNLIRKKYKNVPIIIGGIEASLRRMAHYDYWSSLADTLLLQMLSVSFWIFCPYLPTTKISCQVFLKSLAVYRQFIQLPFSLNKKFSGS